MTSSQRKTDLSSLAPTANIVGIDPSMVGTGLAHVDGTLETIRTKDGQDDLRLIQIAAMTGNALIGAELAIIEDLPRNAKGAGITGLAQGTIRFKLLCHGVPYVKVPAATLKKFATGNGTAGKPDMRMEWYKRTGRDVPDDNQVDAAWLRALGLYLAGHPLFPLPKSHTDKLDAMELRVITNHA